MATACLCLNPDCPKLARTGTIAYASFTLNQTTCKFCKVPFFDPRKGQRRGREVTREGGDASGGGNGKGKGKGKRDRRQHQDDADRGRAPSDRSTGDRRK